MTSLIMVLLLERQQIHQSNENCMRFTDCAGERCTILYSEWLCRPRLVEPAIVWNSRSEVYVRSGTAR